MKNFNINQNTGDGNSKYTGQTFEKESDFFERYVSDNSMIQVGKILDVWSGGYTAQVNISGGTDVAIWLTGILAGLSGTSEITMPNIGSRVLLFRPNNGPAIILGALPGIGFNDGIAYDVESSKIDSFSEGQHNSVYDGTQKVIQYWNSGRPADTLPGDWGVINEFGNVISLLRGLLVLKATNTSQIQLHTIDQLVRIIANAMELMTATGEEVTYNSHGNLTKETTISPKQHESFGVEEDEDISKDGEEVFKEKKSDELEPKPRVHMHTGFLGDLLRILVSKIEGEGLSEMHVGTDGAVNVKSVSEIELRKVGKVKVPKRKKKYYEEEEKELEEKKQFEHNDDVTKVSQDVDKDSWRDEEYNFRKYDEDNWEFKDEDPVAEEDDVEFQDKTSRIVQRADGSIALVDNANSYIELDGNGNIVISCSGDLIMKTGGKSVTLAGDECVLRANNNLIVSCTEGDIRAKAGSAIQMLSKSKGVLIESESTVVPNTEIGEDHEYSGVIIRSRTDSPVMVQSRKNVILWSDENIVCNAEEKFKVQSKEAQLTGDDKILLSSQKYQAEIDEYLVKCSTYTNRNQAFTTTGAVFLMSGSVAGKIHGGSATDINHVHERPEFSYETDCIFGGQKAVRITKTNSDSTRAIVNENFSEVDSLIAPFTRPNLENTFFTFTKQVYEGILSEDLWQENIDNIWNLSKDDIFSTAPFPGIGFTNYRKYVKNEEPAETAGNFQSVNIGEYRIP